jgi:YfiH family protein
VSSLGSRAGRSPPGRMNRQSVDGVVLYRFPELIRASKVHHAILTRLGGVSATPFATLNLGHTVGDAPAAVEENHRRGLGAVGLEVQQIVSPYQVHGSHVGIVGRAHCGTIQPACDALVTAEQGVPLLLRFADCVPILFFDAAHAVIGLAHAGWRGAAANIAGQTVRAMVDRLGCRPHTIWAGIGPAIDRCCYRVEPEVARAVGDGCPPGATITHHQGSALMLDLPTAVQAQLEAAGVGHIERSGLCTACHVDEFFSHRVENGRTGRFGVVLGLTG